MVWQDSHEYAEDQMRALEERRTEELAMAWKDYQPWRPYRFFPWLEYRYWQARGSFDQALGIYGVERRWRKT